MSDILKLSTKKSIHPSVVVEIDGKTYTANPMTHTLFEQIKKFEESAGKGDSEALLKQVQLIYPVSFEVLKNLDIRDITSLLEFTIEKVQGTNSGEGKDEPAKNDSAPGSEESAS